MLAAVIALHRDAEERGLYFQTCEGGSVRGHTVTLKGRDLLSFASCSYLGLELHPALIAGVHDAVDRYGTQFSCSRGYLSAPIYAELEAALEQVFDANILVTPSTTHAHLIALPALATERDAILLDHQGHHSMHLGVNQARAGGTRVELVRHDQLHEAAERIRRLAARHHTVWFVTDGVFSMYGELAPVDFLRQILDLAPNVRLYVDDAHGMSWAGTSGRGSFLHRFGSDPRVVVATSFAKGFGAGGGCLVFQDPAERDRVRWSGGPFVFSGPMQPPMIGAALASARLHLSPELPELQQRLAERVRRANERLIDRNLPPLAVNESPIIFLQCGLPRVAFRAAAAMAERGMYVTSSVYPTVPMRRSGIRFTVTATHTLEDIDRAVDALAQVVPDAIRAEGLSHARVAAFFESAIGAGAESDATDPRVAPKVEVFDTIRDVPRAEWNVAFGTNTHCSWDAMALVEAVYGRPDAPPEHRWDFRYVLVWEGVRLIGAAPITVHLNKDDMLSRPDVSAEIERRRLRDPYAFTSRVVSIGTNLSEGNHLFLDRTRDWRSAARCILSEACTQLERTKANALVVRDLAGDDPSLEAFLLGEGLLRVPGMDSHELTELGETEESWYRALPKKKRQQLRPVLAEAGDFEVSLHGHGLAPLSDALRELIADQYKQLSKRKLRLNIFTFPESLFAALADNAAWEIGVLWLRLGEERIPVAFWASHVHAGSYAPLLCGLEEAWRTRRETYRVMLLAILRRARALGATQVRLGMDAELEKRRLGAHGQATSLYVMALEHQSAELLHDVAVSVALRAKAR